MGKCLSRAIYIKENWLEDSRDLWHAWGHHRVHEVYRVGSLLGKGAFSEVRINMEGVRSFYVKRPAKQQGLECASVVNC